MFTMPVRKLYVNIVSWLEPQMDMVSGPCKSASSGEMHRMLALVDKEAISMLPTVDVLCKD
jgi:hypothetical protein